LDADLYWPVRTLCLSFHSSYRCRHSGECCRAAWEIEVEPYIVEAVQARRILPVISTRAAFAHGSAGVAPTVARTTSGECGFHDQDRCSLQSAGSEAMLPSACRHFPRVYLQDSRGCLLTLSHFCPTAASLLFAADPVTVVDAVAPLALTEPVEGLDARDVLPPLVRPGLLADRDGYAAWELAAVRTLLEAPDPESAFAVIDRATESVREWKPASGPMADAVAGAFDGFSPATRSSELSAAFAIVTELTGPHPAMRVPSDFSQAWQRIASEADPMLNRVAGRYLAAAAFGNWIAYRGRGLRSIVAWIRACYDVLRLQLVRHLGPTPVFRRADVIEALRMADYLMIHTVDSLEFGRAAATLEG
jgi:hypothetical protein